MYIRFLREDFDESSGVFTMTVEPLALNFMEEYSDELGDNSEDIGDTSAPNGIVNYVTAKHLRGGMRQIRVVAADKTLFAIEVSPSCGYAIVKHDVYLQEKPRLWGYERIEKLPTGTPLQLIERINSFWYRVKTPAGRQGFVVSHDYYVQTTDGSLPSPEGKASALGKDTRERTGEDKGDSRILPPGVRLDADTDALASYEADREDKVAAIQQVADSKVGSPYIWGHNEERGEYGFDCSSFTSYVFHKALGYLFSDSCRTQASSVGTPVTPAEMLPGDLLIFDNGRHVGIYTGDGKMVVGGGGLGRVGYLRVGPGSYWYTHLTGAKRMF